MQISVGIIQKSAFEFERHCFIRYILERAYNTHAMEMSIKSSFPHSQY